MKEDEDKRSAIVEGSVCEDPIPASAEDAAQDEKTESVLGTLEQNNNATENGENDEYSQYPHPVRKPEKRNKVSRSHSYQRLFSLPQTVEFPYNLLQ